VKRIVLAYSGGLCTSVAIPWLKEQQDAEVIAVTLDVGQGGEVEEVRDRAFAAGAARAYVLDVREEFARDHLIPALKAGAFNEDMYLLAGALSRPLIARKLVDIARIENASAVAHGCAGTARDQARLELSIKALNPALDVLAPARDWAMTRSDKIEYARARSIPVRVSSRGCSGAGSSYCPDEPAYVDISFEAGVPVAINRVGMAIVDLIASLSTIAGAHGVGRIDPIEDEVAGLHSHAIYEAPAVVVLHLAHWELMRLVVSRDLDRFSRIVSAQYARIIYDGLWFTPIREALDAFVEKVQERATGVIRLKLFKGDCQIVGRRLAVSRDDTDLAAYEGRASLAAT
jgi:argininosuccinate synthase